MRRLSLPKLVVLACLALVPTSFALGGPGDETDTQPPGAVLHVPSTIGDTASSVTVWGHVIKLTGYTYSLSVTLNGAPISPSVTDTITTPNANVDDIQFDVDLSEYALEEDDELDFVFAVVESQTYSDGGQTLVVAN